MFKILQISSIFVELDHQKNDLFSCLTVSGKMILKRKLRKGDDTKEEKDKKKSHWEQSSASPFNR
jgi:hypothetical protein